MREAGCAKGRENECYSVAEAGSKFFLIHIISNMIIIMDLLSAKTF